MSEMITVMQGWFQKPAQYVQMSVEKLEEKLLLQDQRGSRLHWMEVLSKDQATRGYWDIDFPCNPEDYNWLTCELDLLRLLCHNDVNVRSICCMHGKHKLSWHIVGDCYGPRSMWKEVAKKCNRMIETDPEYTCFPHAVFDLRVYGETQRIRLVHTTKPATGIDKPDPEQRIKTPVKGDTRDAFVTYIPPGTPLYKPSNEPVTYEEFLTVNSVPVPSTSASLYVPPHIRWLEAVIACPSFKPHWINVCNDYPKWTAVAASIYFECKTSSELLAYGLTVLQTLSVFRTADPPSSPAWVAKKYPSFHTQEKSLFGQVKAAATTFNSAEAKPFDALYRGQRVMPSSMMTDLEITDDDIQAVDTEDIEWSSFLPVFSFHYRIYQHFQEHAFLAYWKKQITRGEDLKKMLTLIRYMTEDERYWFEAEEGLFWSRMDFIKTEFANILFPFDTSFNQLSVHNAERAFLSNAANLFGLDDFVCPDAWFGEAEDSAAIYQAYQVYAGNLRKQGTLFNNLEKALSSETLFPLKGQEVCDPYTRFAWCLHQYRSGLKWVTQVPYLPFFAELAALCDRDDVDETLTRIILGQKIKDLTAEGVFGFFSNCQSHTKAANIIYSIYPFWFADGDNLFAYDDLSGKYTQNSMDHMRIVSRLSNLLVSRTKTAKGYTLQLLGESQKEKKFMLQALLSLDTLRPDRLQHQRLHRSGQGKLLFPNGYYDATADHFQRAAYLPELFPDMTHCPPIFYWPDIQFYGSVNDPFIPFQNLSPADTATKNMLFDRFFCDMHGQEVADYILDAYACAMFGRVLKSFYVHLGPPNAGKSSFLGMIKACFGELIGDGSLRSLKVSDKEDALQKKVAFRNWSKRAMQFSEGANEQTTFDTEHFKSLANGDNELVTCRSEYFGDVTVPICFTMFIYSNNMLKWSKEEAALWARLVYITWSKMYVDMVTNPDTEILIDPQIKKYQDSEKNRQLFVILVIEAYRRLVLRNQNFDQPLVQPQALKDRAPVNAATAITSDGLIEQLMLTYEFTGVDKHYVLWSDIKDKIAEIAHSTNNYDQGHFTSFFKAYPTICMKQKKVNKKNHNVFIGIQVRSSVMHDTILTDLDQWKSLMARHNNVLRDDTMQKVRQARTLSYIIDRPLSAFEQQIMIDYATVEQLEYHQENSPF